MFFEMMALKNDWNLASEKAAFSRQNLPVSAIHASLTSFFKPDIRVDFANKCVVLANIRAKSEAPLLYICAQLFFL